MAETKSTNPKDLIAASEERCPLAFIPSTALVHIAEAMQDGARKYGPYNYREEGVGAMTYLSAALRHIRAWLDGEESAPDSKVHHLGHAAACLSILMDSQELGIMVDDRPPPAPTAEMLGIIKKEGAAGLAHRPTGFNEYDFDAARAYRRLRKECGLD